MNRMPKVRGVTLIELVLTLILLGILAAVGASRFSGTQTYDERGFAGKMVSALRHAQKTAVSSRCEVQVAIDDSSDSYALTYTGSGACTSGPVTRPGGGNYAEAAPSGVDVRDSVTLRFQPLGSAVVDSGSAPVRVGTFTVAMEPETGMAYVQGW